MVLIMMRSGGYRTWYIWNLTIVGDDGVPVAVTRETSYYHLERDLIKSYLFKNFNKIISCIFSHIPKSTLENFFRTFN